MMKMLSPSSSAESRPSARTAGCNKEALQDLGFTVVVENLFVSLRCGIISHGIELGFEVLHVGNRAICQSLR